MRLSDFDYELPRELIAQVPADRRDASRLLVVPPGGAAPLHRTFAELPGFLPSDALLVVNDVRVIPARLRASKPSGGQVELLLTECESASSDREVWRCLAGGKHLRPGTPLTLSAPPGRTPATPPPPVQFLARHADGTATVAFAVGAPGGVLVALDAWGELPLPPYIERDGGVTDRDLERYQTVFGRVPGAVAAPTAGLHFTPATLEALRARGIRTASITLYVGPGTFQPIREEELERHVMHVERYDVPQATATAVAEAAAAGRSVVAVGTTVVRTLEAAYDEALGGPRPGPGATDLFIRPGHRFRAVDRMITNFHLPRSSLLVLVSAFAGSERIRAVYAEAVAQRYRFFSYGDAMLLSRAAP